MSRLLSIILFALSLLSACSPRPQSPDPRLAGLDAAIDDAPDSALTVLSAIPEATLSPSSRALRNFLIVKASDKARITHTSDSLIEQALAYYESVETDSTRLAEVYYYRGRVASDMADFPKAIYFMRKGLDFLPSSRDNLPLRSAMLSQIGRRLNKIRLLDEAIPYIQEAIEISQELNDRQAELSDLLLLAHTQNLDGKSQLAEHYYRRVMKMSESGSAKNAQALRGLAQLKLSQGDLDSALIYARAGLQCEAKSSRSMILAVAASVYGEVAKQRPQFADSAILLSRQLLDLPNSENHAVAYYVLLSRPMLNKIPLDTTLSYMERYAEILDKRLQANEIELVSNQNNFYNYSNLDRRTSLKIEAARDAVRKTDAVMTAAIALGCIILAVVIMKFRYKKIILRQGRENASLREDNRLLTSNQTTLISKFESLSSGMAMLQEAVSSIHSIGKGNDSGIQTLTEKFHKISSEIDKMQSDIRPIDLENRRRKIREEVLAEFEKSLDSVKTTPLPLPALLREQCSELRSLLREKKSLSDDSDTLQYIAELSETELPNLRHTLDVITSSPLTLLEWNYVYLEKLGLTLSEKALLLARSKSTIVSRRETIAVKIFGDAARKNQVDDLIQFIS